jgi:hypothetical protein
MRTGSAFLAFAALLFFFSPLLSVLSKAAAALALVGLGCFIASALKWFAYCKERLFARYPRQRRRVGILYGLLTLWLCSAYAIWLPISALVYDQTTAIGRGKGMLSRSLDPTGFWLSVVFHGALGLFVLGASAYLSWRHRRWFGLPGPAT